MAGLASLAVDSIAPRQAVAQCRADRQARFVMPPEEGAFGEFAITGATLLLGQPGHTLLISEALGIHGPERSGIVSANHGAWGTWTFSAYLGRTSVAAEDHFGSALSADGDTVAVGAPDEDAGGLPDSGAVYVYGLTTAGWVLMDRLVPPDPGEQVGFGRRIALRGHMLAVSSGAGPTGWNGNPVYIFERRAGRWQYHATVKRPWYRSLNVQSPDRFGESLAIEGDTLIVGSNEGRVFAGEANWAPWRPSLSGSVHVYRRAGDAWSIETELSVRPEGLGAFDRFDAYFGWAVSLDGDSMLIGAPFEANGDQRASGAAYVFRRRAGRWEQVERLVAPGAAAEARQFGHSVTLRGGTAVVGAPSGWSHNNWHRNDEPGTAEVFVRRPSGSFAHAATLGKFEPGREDRFGRQVHLMSETEIIVSSKDSVEGFVLNCDADVDGVSDLEDNCQGLFNPVQIDCDGDGIGDDCDVHVGTAWYRDADGDGAGDENSVLYSCAQPSGYVSNSADFDDSDPAVRGPVPYCGTGALPASFSSLTLIGLLGRHRRRRS